MLNLEWAQSCAVSKTLLSPKKVRSGNDDFSMEMNVPDKVDGSSEV